MELLQKVLVSERLPIIEDTYIVEYKEGYSAKINYAHFIKHVIEADWENNVEVIKDSWLNKLEAWYEPIELEKEADERYKLAIGVIKEHSNWFDLPEYLLIEKALKIAAYGKSN